MTNSTQTFQSRFGFHPCDYATFQKLRELKKRYWQTVRDFHRWWRWQRKRPENRRGPEPQFCPLFVKNERWFKPRRVHGQEAVRYYPKTLVDHGILELFAAARQPQTDPPTPLDESRLRLFERLHSACSSRLPGGTSNG
jgi:hypothetical protein